MHAINLVSTSFHYHPEYMLFNSIQNKKEFLRFLFLALVIIFWGEFWFWLYRIHFESVLDDGCETVVID